ncbi:DNA cytosine methyltransferase [Treponema peruense]|uniref:DNA cytosine methyltransferase n=1 Tax=Treponema peruense TaxID=2787628 RepID=UPI0018E1D214
MTINFENFHKIFQAKNISTKFKRRQHTDLKTSACFGQSISILCSGIGAGRLGLEQSGLKCVGFSDTSRLAETTYRLLHNTEGEKNYGNLRKIKIVNLLKEQDYNVFYKVLIFIPQWISIFLRFFERFFPMKNLPHGGFRFL